MPEENIFNKDEIKKFIHENSSLFWWVKPEEKENISLNALVETILNYGDEKSVNKLISLVGIKTVASVFMAQISGKRSNYNKRTKHYFTMYFKKHVS